MSKFSELIDEVADQKNHSLSDVLMKAKVLASHLKSRKFRQWIDTELNGYGSKKNLPEYRVISSRLFGDFGGYFGQELRHVPLSVSHPDPSIRETFEKEPISSSVSYIEDIVSADQGEIGRSLNDSIVDFLRKYGTRMNDMILNHVIKSVSRHALIELLNNVRSKLLDFLLELRDQYPELDSDDNAPASLNASAIDAAADRKFYQNCTFVEGSGMRDIYQAGQAAAMGPDARAENINFIQVLRDAIGQSSLADLAKELAKLRTAMLTEAKDSNRDNSVAEIAQAEEAAKKADAKGVIAHLRNAGKLALDMAIKLGTAVAEKAIEKSMGL